MGVGYLIACAETKSQVPQQNTQTSDEKKARSDGTATILPEGMLESLTADWDVQPATGLPTSPGDLPGFSLSSGALWYCSQVEVILWYQSSTYEVLYPFSSHSC